MVAASQSLGSNYELLSRLGGGAMGEVWLARDRETGAEYAAKVLRSEFAHNPDIVARFVQERSILMSLDHPGIVRVRDLVVERDSLAIVMDLVDGSDLRAVLRESGTLQPALAVRLVADVLEALAAAHRAGALHRDVKPDNVLLTRDWRDLAPGGVRLSDFSIARLAQESTVQATGLLGTPEYMPPELFEHGTTSAASDVYAAGVLLYELLAGRTPFAGEGTAFTIGNRAVTLQPPVLAVPDQLWRLLAVLLDKDPRTRLRADAAAGALRSLADGLQDAPALPVQPTPGSWQRSGAAGLTPGTIRPAETPAGLDVGGTNLDVTFTPEAPAAASAGEVQALVPDRPPLPEEYDAGVTQLGLPAREYAAPVLRPEAEAPSAVGRSGRGRTILIGLAAAVLLVGGGFGVAALAGGRDGGSGSSAHGQLEAVLEAEPVPGSGLEVTRSATYDADDGSVDLTVDLRAGRVPLRSPILQAIPRPDDAGECPLVAWEGAEASPNPTMTTGIDATCGFALDVGEIPAGQSVTVTATMALDLPDGDGGQAGLDRWLASAAELTDTALAGAGPTNAAYPAQRLESVEVEVLPAYVTVRTRQLRVVLHPRWVGAEQPDRQHPLFDSSLGETTELLDQVGGGLDGVRLADGCDGGLSIRDGRVVSVQRQSEDCTVLVSVGHLTDLTSIPFQIHPVSG